MRINPFYLHGEEFTPVRKLLALHALAGGVPLTEYTETGNPVTFDTNVAKPLSECLLSFLPVQSGTGDPSPENVRPITGWTGAKAWHSGANLCPPLVIDGTIASTDYFYLPLEHGEKYTWSGLTNKLFSCVYAYNSAKQLLGRTYNMARSEFTFSKADFTQGTPQGTGEIAYIRLREQESTSGYSIDLVNDCDYMLNPGTEALPYEEYEAPESVSVTFPATGKNLFDKNAVETGKLWWKGSKQADEDQNASALIPVIPGETYTLYRSTTVQNQVEYFDQSGVYLTQDLAHWVQTTSTYAIPDGVYYVAFNVKGVSLDSAMFVKGNSAGDYEPYTNTAYGGTLDLATGVLTVDWEKFPLKNQTWNNYSGNVLFYKELRKDKKSSIMCDSFPAVNGQPNTDQTVGSPNNGTNSASNLFFYKTGMANATEFREWINGLEIDPYVVFKLATPLVYQLTPSEIQTLIGTNVLWSDTNGDMEIKYLKKG